MRIDMNGMEWGWADRALDSFAIGLAAVHVGMQQIPILGTAYAGGSRLGEAIYGERVEYSSQASGPRVQELSLDQRSQAAFDGTKTVGTLVAAGAIPGATSVTTGTTVTTQGAVATTQVVVSNGSVAGAAAMAMTGGPGRPKDAISEGKMKDKNKELTKEQQKAKHRMKHKGDGDRNAQQEAEDHARAKEVKSKPPRKEKKIEW